MNSKNIRTRIAPSPTGNLHVGTARTALFNELFAHKHGGVFILRLEDTDQERSEAAFEQNILDGLSWLGLSWDEGPFKQSERGDLYKSALEKLLADGKAKKGEGDTIVLIVEPQEVSFIDEVRGKVTVHTDSFGGDFIIARSMEKPLFHLAVVVDDADMGVTHVIRGEDHLHNTIKHILIQQALGYESPIYAHLPLLLDEKRAKLSKRAGETDLLAFRDEGFLPQTMLNYLALLGWNPKNDREFFTHDELIETFSLEGIQKGGAIFSKIKLSSMNKEYLMKLSDENLLAWATYHYDKEGVAVTDPSRLLAALKTELGRFATYDVGGMPLHRAMAWHEPSWSPDKEDLQKSIVWKKSDSDTARDRLKQLIAFIEPLPEDSFTATALEKTIIEWIDENNLGRGETLWPMRVALCGREHSPGPFDIATVIGKEATVGRLRAAQAVLNEI